MHKRQKQSIEAYQRVQRFLDVHPLPEPGGYGASQAVLDDVVAQLVNHSTNQRAGGREGRAETQRQQALIRRLRARHLTPIAKVARALLVGRPGIGVALKAPSRRLGVTQLVTDAAAIRQAVTPYEAVFVANNLPADFLARLDAAIGALAVTVQDRGENAGDRVGAGIGIVNEIRRGRDAVEILDAFITTRFADDPVILGRWRVAKRVQAPRGGVVAAEGDAANATPVRPAAS